MWSTEKTLQLIELLHSSPVLWDVTNEDYKSRVKKMDALREIATTVSVSEIDTEKKDKIPQSTVPEGTFETSFSEKNWNLPKELAFLYFVFFLDIFGATIRKSISKSLVDVRRKLMKPAPSSLNSSRSKLP